MQVLQLQKLENIYQIISHELNIIHEVTNNYCRVRFHSYFIRKDAVSVRWRMQQCLLSSELLENQIKL